MSIETQRSTPRRGQALIGVLVTVGIIIAVAGIYLSVKGKNPDGSTSTKTALKRSIDLAQEVALQSNLQQIQMFIGMYKGDNDGKIPASLEELKTSSKYPAEMFINPVDKKPLGYDPNTGLMIVTPYEGESRQIIKMTTAPAAGSEGASTPATGGAPVMPNIPTVPNSGETASGEEVP